MSECPGCGERHEDWTIVSEHAVEGPYHAGIVEVAECGNCGEEMQGGRR
jgi:ribosomal protein L32